MATKIKGQYASWANFALRIRGDDIVWDPEDFAGFDWKQSLTPGRAPRKGPGKGGRTRGVYECEAKLVLYKDAARIFLQTLRDAHPVGAAGEVEFDIIGQWEPENEDDVVLEVKAEGCRLMEAGGSVAPGEEPNSVEIPLDADKVWEDGVCLIGDR